MRKLYFILNYWRIFLVWLMINSVNEQQKFLIIDEIRYWGGINKRTNKSDFQLLGDLLLYYKEYRNLLVYRVHSDSFIKSRIIGVLFKQLDSLVIKAEKIGPRLYIQHGFSTYIAAKEIGCNCWINQQVTIGYSFSDEPPIIGNGVRITAGAKIIGNIVIGDNSIIGANAVVVKKVEENTVVGGVPAVKIGINDEHKLFKGYEEVEWKNELIIRD